MACEVCEHCQDPLSDHERIIHEGYSYHKRCRKCYVCSETDLYNAEVFKGVIFCYSCSKRIFQGCSTVRRAKTASKKYRQENRRQTTKERRLKDRARSAVRHVERRIEKVARVLELTQLDISTDTDRSSDLQQKIRVSNPVLMSPELVTQAKTDTQNSQSKEIGKKSAEMGTTTVITQNDVIMNHLKQSKEKKPVDPPPAPIEIQTTARTQEIKTYDKVRKPRGRQKRRKNIPSDLRMAEFGASTEIANMALRKKSEMPVIIKSKTPPPRLEESSTTNPETGSSADDWYQSVAESSGYTIPIWDRRFNSIMKLPIKFFKTHVVQRSSLISTIMDEDEKQSPLEKLRQLFYEEITEHQERGVRRLYSTINRRKKEYKLGWLPLKSKENCCLRSGDCEKHPVICKHFRRSHSYRCMRRKAMRLAGPTSEELGDIRSKLKQTLLGSVRGKIDGGHQPAWNQFPVSLPQYPMHLPLGLDWFWNQRPRCRPELLDTSVGSQEISLHRC